MPNPIQIRDSETVTRRHIYLPVAINSLIREKDYHVSAEGKYLYHSLICSAIDSGCLSARHHTLSSITHHPAVGSSKRLYICQQFFISISNLPSTSISLSTTIQTELGFPAVSRSSRPRWGVKIMFWTAQLNLTSYESLIAPEHLWFAMDSQLASTAGQMVSDCQKNHGCNILKGSSFVLELLGFE